MQALTITPTTLAYFPPAPGAEIRNLILEDPEVLGIRYVGSICGGTTSADNTGVKLVNVHITGGSIQGHTAASASSSIGGLVGYLGASGDHIIGSRSSADVSDGGMAADYMGGLVGYSAGSITGSSSSGAVGNGGAGDDHMGGLVGYLHHSSVRDSYSSASVCDGSGTNCATAGTGDDNVGALIGTIFGEETANTDTAMRSQVHNSLATVRRSHGAWQR